MGDIIVGWYRINEETDELEPVESVFKNAEERTAFFEKEIQTGLVYDWSYVLEGPDPEEIEAFAAMQANLREVLGDEYDLLFPGSKK